MEIHHRREAELPNGWVIIGEVYNVREFYEEMIDYPKERLEEIPIDWFEYKMTLLNEKGEIIAEWDSQFETYDGIHKLTLEQAKSAVDEVVEDCLNGKVSSWFNVKEGSV